MNLIWVAVILLLILCISIGWAEITVSSARRRGLYPPRGEITMDTVKDLALKGEETLAMRAYREISGASLKEAREIVKGIVRSAEREIRNNPG